jgi:RHS repeat-associated protein
VYSSIREELYRSFPAPSVWSSPSVVASEASTDVTTYAYDPNGNQTRSGDRHFSYNLENKLVKVSDKHGHEQVSYTYTEDGLMQARSEGSEITAYSWDTLGDLPELAVETTSKKSSWHFEIKDSRSYSYGEGSIGIEAGRDSITFHTDSLGSVVQLSDEKGKLLQSYRYSPFGGDYSSTSALNAKADDLNPIRFTGQYLDSETDLYNMRAREYDPETARFLETDPVSCEEGGACGSVYVYVDDRPTVETDPSGESPKYYRTGAVAWAIGGWRSDRDYHRWSSDNCTNFVSYAMRDGGGWEETGGWKQHNCHGWFFSCGPTHAWGAAEPFFNYWATRTDLGISTVVLPPTSNGRYPSTIFSAKRGDVFVMQTHHGTTDFWHSEMVRSHLPGSHSQIWVVNDEHTPKIALLNYTANGLKPPKNKTLRFNTSEDHCKSGAQYGKWPTMGLIHFPG